MTLGTNEKSKITFINYSYLDWTILSTNHNALGASRTLRVPSFCQTVFDVPPGSSISIPTENEKSSKERGGGISILKKQPKTRYHTW